MKMTFKEFLTEARIAVPPSTKKEVMSIVVSAYFNYIAQLLQKQGKKPGQAFLRALRQARRQYGHIELYDFPEGQKVILKGTATYYVNELPDHYKSSNLKDSKLKVLAGDYGDSDPVRAEYYGKGSGRPGLIRVNILVPGMDLNPGDAHSILDDLDDLEQIVQHELQHSTQDSALRKKHASQFVKADSVQDTQSPAGREEYFKSNVEFQPQITTAAADFRRSITALRSHMDLTPEQVQGIAHSFLTGGAMPTGLLKWKPYFNSEFFRTLHRTSPVKWKKAVKDFHGLVSKSNVT